MITTELIKWNYYMYIVTTYQSSSVRVYIPTCIL